MYNKRVGGKSDHLVTNPNVNTFLSCSYHLLVCTSNGNLFVCLRLCGILVENQQVDRIWGLIRITNMSNVSNLEKLGVNEHDFRLIIGSSKIEYDENKEQSNIKEHGYSLEDAIPIFERLLLPFGHGEFRVITTRDTFNEYDEIRHNHIGVHRDGKLVFIVTTMRKDESVRIISLRRAHKKERKEYRGLTGYSEK